MADPQNPPSPPPPQIDLSAGIVPTTPTPAPKIDLSAGMVPAADQTSAEPSTLVGKIDHAISWLTRPADPGETSWTGAGGPHEPTYKGPVEYALRKGVGSVASMVRHPLDTANAAGGQIGEAPLAAIDAHVREILTPQVEEALHKRGYSTAAVDKALALTDQAYADIHDQLHAMGHEAIHDPYAFVGEQGAQALFFHYLGVGAGKTGAALSDTAKATAARAGKAVLGVGPAETATVVRSIAQDNADKLKAAAKDDADAAQKHLDDTQDALNETRQREDVHDYKQKVAQAKADVDHAQATVDVHRYNQRMLNRHQAEVNRVTEANSALDHTKDLRTQREADLAKQTADYYAQEDAVKAKAKTEERAAWKPWDDKMGKVEIDGGEIATPLTKITTKSPEMSRLISQLVPDPADVSPTSQFAQDRSVVMKSLGYGNDYWDLPSEKKGVVDQITKERGFEPDPIDFDPQVGQQISINDVQRAKSILGQHIASGRYEGYLLGEMKQVYSVLDRAVNKASTEAGAGEDLTAAKEATKRYQRAFGRERHQPTTVDEVREKQANPEAYKAREDQARLDAAKAHDPSLVDNYEKVKQARADLDRMPTEEKLRKQVKQVPRPPTVGDIRGKYQLKEPPKPLGVLQPDMPPDRVNLPDRPPAADPNLTPTTTDEIKDRNVKKIQAKLEAYRNVSVYRVAEMAAGTVSVVSGVASLLTKAAGMHAASESLGLASGGAFLFALGPRLLANMLDSPKILDQLATPTLADYDKVMKMPPEQRAGFESAITQLAKAAEKSGKLKKPSPWISFFSKVATGAAAVNKPARERQQKDNQTQQQQLDKDVMKDADEALRLANESKVVAPKFTATHGTTGHKLGHDGQRWYDMQTGQPVNG